VGASAFLTLSSCEREAKKRAQKREEKERGKSESAERERKKRELALFPPPTVEIRFQSPKPLGRGNARVLSKRCTVQLMC
jgi:hypothetical protein